jgi:tetratricopeptide (TPR) repeat protein
MPDAIRAEADDQIFKNDGTTITGQVIGVADGQVTVQSTTSRGGIAKVPYPLSDIKAVTMAIPAPVLAAQAQGITPAAIVAALEPQVKLFAGLPADWVVGAMAQLADAYAAQGQPDKSEAVYDQIVKLYPGSSYEAVAKAGKADMSLKAGKIDDALAAVQPMIDKANQNIAPSPTEGAVYAKAFLVYGQVKEKQGKPQEALEAYLTVKTMFYQNPALAAQADELAKAVRDKNAGLGVN